MVRFGCLLTICTADLEVTKKAFNFAKKNCIPFHFVSASNGTNVVRLFTDAVRAAVAYKENSTDILDQIMEELDVGLPIQIHTWHLNGCET